MRTCQHFRRYRKAFTLIEMLTVIGVIAILAAILIPALAAAKSRSHRTVCQSNMKQIGLGFFAYATDHDGKMVPQSIIKAPPTNAIGPTGEGTHTYWPDLMRDSISERKLLVCPAFRIPGGYGIGYNTPEFGVYDTQTGAQYPTIGSIESPGASVVFADVSAISNPNEPDPDKWKPTADGKLTIGSAMMGVGVPASAPGITLGPEYNVYFRDPNDSAYSAIPHRLVNRHSEKSNCWNPNGAVELRKASSLGFQYYSSSAASPDPRWMWDR